jgi:hypothetical protein
MQQLGKLRIAGKFFERAPILLAGFRMELGANRSQVHRTLVPLRLSGRIVVRVLAVKVFVLFVLAHTVH